MIKAITTNVEVGQGGGKERQRARRCSATRRFAYSLPPGPRLPVADRRARGLRRPDDSRRENIQTAVQRVPRSGRRVAREGDARSRSAEAEGQHEGAERRARRRSLVLNGNGVDGLRPAAPATCSAARLPDAPAAGRTPTPNAPSCDYFRTQDLLRSAGEGRGRRPRRRSLTLFGSADVAKLVPEDPRALERRDADVVVVGQTFHGQLAPSAGRPRRRSGSRPNVVPGRAPPLDLLRAARARRSVPADGADRDRARRPGSTRRRPIRAVPDRPGQEAQGRPADVPDRRRTSTGASR